MRFLLLALVLASCSSGENDSAPEIHDGSGRDHPFAPPEGGVRRLLVPQYLNTVRYFFGPDAAQSAKGKLPEDVAAEGFVGVGAGTVPPSLMVPEQYQEAALAVAEAVACDVRDHGADATLAAFVPCVGESPPDPGCYLTLAEQLAPLLFRRPATVEEVQSIRTVGIQGYGLGNDDFVRGLRYVVFAMLQAPSFLYIVEVGEPDPANPGWRRLTAYEIASRMSFFLTDTTPDQELMATARDGSLSESAVRRAQAARLLETPAARETIRRRFAEFLAVERVAGASKDASLYPEFDDLLRSAMVEEVDRVVEDIVFTEDTDVRDLLFGAQTLVNAPLAELYGIADVPGPEAWSARSLPESRAGFLTSGAFLTGNSQEVRTSPSRRGAFIRRRVLCEPLERHAPDIPDALPDLIDDDQTTREALEAATADDPCASCHRTFDPLGFALEGFDAIGRSRVSEGARAIDTATSLDDIGDFEDARSLADRILDDPNERASVCLMLNVFRGGLGRLETDGEISPLTELYDSFRGDGFRLKPLLVDMTDSRLFLFVREGADD